MIFVLDGLVRSYLQSIVECNVHPDKVHDEHEDQDHPDVGVQSHGPVDYIVRNTTEQKMIKIKKCCFAFCFARTVSL